MLARLQKFKRDEATGFTLIELLVVIVIIGILAAIAIPLFLNQRKKGVDASLKSDVKNAASTVETWMTDNPSDVVPSGAGANVALEGFTPGEGNTVTVTGSATIGVYCIDAASDSSSRPDEFIVYDANAGGLLADWDANGCAA